MTMYFTISQTEHQYRRHYLVKVKNRGHLEERHSLNVQKSGQLRLKIAAS